MAVMALYATSLARRGLDAALISRVGRSRPFCKITWRNMCVLLGFQEIRKATK
jgi:hypothetical protein